MNDPQPPVGDERIAKLRKAIGDIESTSADQVRRSDVTAIAQAAANWTDAGLEFCRN